MSRKIDLYAPLSDDDREFLLANGRTMDIALNEAYLAEDDEAVSAASVPDGHPGSVPVAVSARVGAVTGEQADSGSQAEADSTDGSEADAEDAEDLEDDEDDDNYDDADVWSHKDLQEEVRERREAAGENYDGPSLKASSEDLVEWLRKDDKRD